MVNAWNKGLVISTHKNQLWVLAPTLGLEILVYVVPKLVMSRIVTKILAVKLPSLNEVQAGKIL